MATYGARGALLLVPAISNIVLIDVFYGIDLAATVVALVILGVSWP